MNEENKHTALLLLSLAETKQLVSETLDTKNKMLTAYRAESDKFKKIAGINDVTEVLYVVYLFNLLIAETKQLPQVKVLHLTECEEVSEKLDYFIVMIIIGK